MLDNLADFEPRRWFAKLRPTPENGKDKNGKDKEEASGLATLAAAENGEDDTASCPWSSATSLRRAGWSTSRSCRSAGATPLDDAAADMLAGVLRKRGLGAKELRARGDLRRAYRLAHRDRGEARLPVLSRPRQRPRADPLSGAALAAHPAARHADHGLLLGRGGRPALGQIAAREHRGRRLRHLAAEAVRALHEGRQGRAEEQACRRQPSRPRSRPASPARNTASAPRPAPQPNVAPDKPKREPKRKSQSAVA